MVADRAPDPAAVQVLHDRYLHEVVEAFGLCPFARRCREQGRVARPLFYAEAGAEFGVAPTHVAEQLATVSRAQADLEVVLLTFVLPADPEHLWHDVDRFEDVVRAVRSAYEARGADDARYYMVGFHPKLTGPAGPRPLTADGLVPWLRRTPDPVIQCIRADLLDQVRRQAQAVATAKFLAEMEKLGPEYRMLAASAIQSDPELSADIARHNFANVGSGDGRAALDRSIAAILVARNAMDPAKTEA